MPIDTKHPQYQVRAPQWVKIRDAIDGQDAVKAKGVTYLPALSSQKESYEGAQAYASYLARASFHGAVGRTRKGISGAIMRKPPTLEGVADAQRSTLFSTAGVKRQSADAVAAELLDETLIGRAGILVDKAADPNARPYMASFRPEQIINWAEQDIDGRMTSTMFVLQTDVAVPDESDRTGIASKTEQRWVVLRLGTPEDLATALGEESPPPLGMARYVYWQEEWRQANSDEKTTDGFVLLRVTVPTKRGGRVWERIPFAVASADAGVPPLLDLANLVYSHYLNSADLEWGSHLTAIPQPWAAGFDVQEGDSLVIGSGRAWVTPSPDGKVGYLEFTGAGLGQLATLMENKQKTMAVLGSRLLEAQPNAAETMGAVRLRQSGDRSVVTDLADDVSRMMTEACRWVMEWETAATATDKVVYKLSADFDAMPIDPAQMQALMAALQNGTMSWETFAWNMRRGELLPPGVTDEQERERITRGAPGRDNAAELALLQSDVREGRITQATYLQRCKDLGLYPADMDVEAEVELTATGHEDDAPEPDDEMPLDEPEPVEEKPEPVPPETVAKPDANPEAMTLNELTLGIERLARIGDSQGLNVLRDRLASMLEVQLPDLKLRAAQA